MRVNPEKGGEALAKQFSIRGFPTMVFADAAGKEVDRIVGYLPPKEFLAQLARIRSGQTAAAAIARLDADPGDGEALRPAVRAFLDRGDPAAALLRIKTFREVNPGAPAADYADLEFEGQWSLQTSLFRKAAKALLKKDGGEPPVVPAAAQAPALAALLADPATAKLSPQELGVKLHEARYSDSGTLLAEVPVDQANAEQLFQLADSAFSTGHYDRAADLYTQWYQKEGADASSGALNQAAWNLYLARKALDQAVAMARAAYQQDGSPGVADTLARALYASGQVDEAVTVESKAASGVEGSEAEGYQKIVAEMKAGKTLDDQPSFESWPKVPKA